MKTSDKIKKGLECCKQPVCPKDCPYNKPDGICDLTYDMENYILWLEEQVPKWISVKDRLPEDDDDVLIFSNERVIFVGCYKNGQWISYSLYAIYGNVVTHWMPIPEIPKEE